MYQLARPPAALAAEHLWLVFVHFTGDASAAATGLPLCYHLTPRLERYDATRVLLDLGTRAEAEARALTAALLARLDSQGIAARAGIAPSGALAQLALLSAPAGTDLALVTPATAPARVQSLPVRVLLALAPRGLVAAETVARLERFGLRTLGQLAQLGEASLRRQFGSQAGGLLAALCRGADSRPLQPTPPAHWHRARLRLCPAVSPGHALLALPQLVRRTLPSLHGHVVQAVRLGVGWESGGRQELALSLRERTADAHLLTQEAQRLLLALLAATGSPAGGGAIEELRLALGACAHAVPEQASFDGRDEEWRQAALARIAASLAWRHGRPLVLRSRLVSADAIFAEERYHLLPSDDEHGNAVAAQVTPATEPGASRQPPGSAVASAWEHVPQRLHWW